MLLFLLIQNFLDEINSKKAEDKLIKNLNNVSNIQDFDIESRLEKNRKINKRNDILNLTNVPSDNNNNTDYGIFQ